jgi:RimJ/RimL family protein N-acetyltransferase
MLTDSVSVQAAIPAARFLLRPLRRSDAGLIAHYCADPRVARGTAGIPHPLPPGTAESMVERAMRADRAQDVWAMDGTGSASPGEDRDEVLGLISLTRIERAQSEVHYWVAPAFWNTGLASEAVRALIQANPHRSGTLFAEVFQDNPVSARVLTNCGFEYLGDAEVYCVSRAANVPTWTYSLKLG